MLLLGSPEANADPQLLSSKNMGRLIEGLRKYADVIILDTPPSAMLVDAMLVSKYVDEAIYVIMCDYTKKNVVISGIQELSSAGVEIGGFILNGAEGGTAGYGYHSYGYNSHYYADKKKET